MPESEAGIAAAAAPLRGWISGFLGAEDAQAVLRSLWTVAAREGSRGRQVTQAPVRGIPLRADVGIAYRSELRISNVVLFMIVG